MTEEEFYKLKIFNKISINQIKRDYPNHAELINNCYKSEKYYKIQNRKQVLSNKLKHEKDKNGNLIVFTNEQIYDLYKWYINTPKICGYCGLQENKLEVLNNMPKHINKRYPQRGTSLEIDRKEPETAYSNIKNLVLACYWCNNAKTDTFTYSEFSKIGIMIKEIWKERFKQNKNKKIKTMPIPKIITRNDVIQVIKQIDNERQIPSKRLPRKVALRFNKTNYPVKILISWGYEVATGQDLIYSSFVTQEAVRYLTALGFEIVRINK